MRLLLGVLFLFIFQFSWAQAFKVIGYCVDLQGTPIANVQVFCDKADPKLALTNDDGFYELNILKPDTLSVYYRMPQLEEFQRFYANGDMKARQVKFGIQQVVEISVQGSQNPTPGISKLPTIDLRLIPGTRGIEQYLLYATVATSNNELTSNYNVRGGNYDENLVYVNGFAVYRPFLTRAGQQEGMSFINTALVESIRFSGGGFDAEYGDKLSSVLDITYKTPSHFHGSLSASLLGVEAHVEHDASTRFNYLVGARYRANGYLLNSLPTKGSYNPVFWDAQVLTNYYLSDKLTWSLLGHFSSNNYQFAPETQKTDFGTAQEAYSFNVYFEGQEDTRFQTMMGGTALKWKPTKKTNLDLYATAFNTVEREYFDILGEYFINELETDPSKEEFGDSISVLGIGSFLSHARNKLDATIVNVYHNGEHVFKKGFSDEARLQFRTHALRWGVNFQQDYFYDKLSEWKLIDSAGYSLPQGNNDKVELFEVIKSEQNLQAQRYTGFFQFNSNWSNNRKNVIAEVSKKYRFKDTTSTTGRTYREKLTFIDTIWESPNRWILSIGARSGYTTANEEFYVTPRATVRFFPRVYMVRKKRVVRRNVEVRFSTGLYYQPPFYREFRTFTGGLNLDVKAQKSYHAVLGTDVYFDMWEREVPFKFTAEAYYKYLWDINPYEIENVRTRYYADNIARGYAYGVDLNVNGQFVEGIESFFKLSLLRTQEDIQGDFYYDYYNAAGELIKPGISTDIVAVDSVRQSPGYVPRPTDQRISFAALVQDRMPKFESLSVQMGLQFGSRLPYGPPDYTRYKDTLRQKSYFRVDIGMSYDFLYKYRQKEMALAQLTRVEAEEQRKDIKRNFFNRTFTDAILSFEVFNLLGVNNVLSKQWIQDVSGKYYSIPNYLTQRRFNLKLILRF